MLKRITDAIRRDERHQFKAYSRGEVTLKKRLRPIDILPLLEEAFFFIAEIKRRSPSKGVIRRDWDPVSIAREYEAGGASAVSVVTERNFFGGRKEYLSDIKNAIALPVLRKDFIIHPYQVCESYNLGADFILLIAACLDDAELAHLYTMARSLGMNALVEVHTEGELERVLRLSPLVIGINNRNLETLHVDLSTSLRLRRLVPEGIFVISESGIRDHGDIGELKKDGFAGVLIGQALLEGGDIAATLREMCND